jgi:hypothetical protein
MEHDMSFRRVSIRHWLPLVTFCPVNHLPDLLYVTVDFDDNPVVDPQFNELYTVRKKVRKLVSWKKMFMEDIAEKVYNMFPECSAVTVSLLFNRHVVIRGEE